MKMWLSNTPKRFRNIWKIGMLTFTKSFRFFLGLVKKLIKIQMKILDLYFSFYPKEVKNACCFFITIPVNCEFFVSQNSNLWVKFSIIRTCHCSGVFYLATSGRASCSGNVMLDVSAANKKKGQYKPHVTDISVMWTEQEVVSDLGFKQAAVRGISCAPPLPLLPLWLDFCSQTETLYSLFTPSVNWTVSMKRYC